MYDFIKTVLDLDVKLNHMVIISIQVFSYLTKIDQIKLIDYLIKKIHMKIVANIVTDDHIKYKKHQLKLLELFVSDNLICEIIGFQEPTNKHFRDETIAT